jgi:hypothetical protein
MARRSVARSGAAWGCAAALALTACGGPSFVFTGGPDASTDAGAPAPADAAPADFEIACGALQCDYPNSCCNGTDPTLSANCTGGNGQCGGCQARLSCASAANCPGNMLCCIGPAPAASSSCTNGAQRFASVCRLLCGTAETRMCDPSNPSASPCLAGRTCSGTASSLAQWGLPSDGSGYGVCPAN